MNSELEAVFLGSCWGARRDSNPEPSDPFDQERCHYRPRPDGRIQVRPEDEPANNADRPNGRGSQVCPDFGLGTA